MIGHDLVRMMCIFAEIRGDMSRFKYYTAVRQYHIGQKLSANQQKALKARIRSRLGVKLRVRYKLRTRVTQHCVEWV